MSRYSKSMSDAMAEVNAREAELLEVSPPGFKGTVKAMKKHDEIDNPYALAWHMKNKGDKAHYKDKDGKPEKKEKYKNEEVEVEESSRLKSSLYAIAVKVPKGWKIVFKGSASEQRKEWKKMEKAGKKSRVDFRGYQTQKPVGHVFGEEVELEEGHKDYHCKDCGCKMHESKPDCKCEHDCHDESGSWWVDKDGNSPNKNNEFKVKEEVEIEEGGIDIRNLSLSQRRALRKTHKVVDGKLVRKTVTKPYKMKAWDTFSKYASKNYDKGPRRNPYEEVEIEEGIGSLKNAKRDTEHMRKAAGYKVDKQTTTKTSGGTLRKTTYKKDAEEVLRKRKEKTREMEKKARSSYLEPDLKKRQANNEKAIRDMKKMAPKMRNPHLEQVEREVNEVSNELLARYKTKAADDHRASDKVGNYKRADKRFSGIMRATNKQFSNDRKEILRKRAEKTREMEKKLREHIDKVHEEALRENEKMTEQAEWKVKLKGLPVFYVPSNSAASVKAMLRKQLKRQDDIVSIERAYSTKIRKDYRDRIAGKDEDENNS